MNLIKIILHPQGTHGDVRPILALGLAFRNAGHRVEFCSAPDFAQLFSQYNFPFHSVGPNIQTILRETLKSGRMNKNSIRSIMYDSMSVQFNILTGLAKDANLIIGSGIDFAGRSVAEHFGIPYYLVCHIPLFFKSSYHAPMGMTFSRLPRWLNRVCWRTNELVMNKVYNVILNDLRRQLDLPETNMFTYMRENIFFAADPILAPVPPDVNSKFVQSGYWHLEEETELDVELQQFIEAGAPPVFIGFGSMTDPFPAQTSMILQELVDSKRYRLIISKGWANLEVNHLNQNIFLIDHVPHAKLFPKMGAIVHHGGAGTTHTAARAGIPQVIIPHVLDQNYWGERISSLKIGTKPIIRGRLSSRNLMSAIDEAITDQEIKRNARETGELLSKQDGLKEALDHFNAILR